MGNRVCFIGAGGKLGLPCAEIMNQAHEVTGYDIVPFESTIIKRALSLKSAMDKRDYIFIAVPTPHEPGYGGEAPIAGLEPKDFNYDIVIDVLTKVKEHLTERQTVVLISTVLPGTVRNQFVKIIPPGQFIYNPYLIAMGSVKWDMVNPECIIIGTDTGNRREQLASNLIGFYGPLMKNNPKIHVGTWDEAEAIKIFYNTMISAKIGLVNMMQDVAEKNGNINVDVVTTALKEATQRITGPRYLTAGMGDAGACHPRDNIALRWLSKDLDLGYDLFHAVMESRDHQAENLALRLAQLSTEYNLPIVIHGRSYKPGVSYTDGSYSELIMWYLNHHDYDAKYVDPLTGDNYIPVISSIFLMAHDPLTTYAGTGMENKAEYKYYCHIPENSVILDPWRRITKMHGSKVLHYGNPRFIG